ncbi:PREDICTED: tectonin beta-propeller repeat-containing protein 2 [Condylura cristata]|uniref:tectonin beta-propeller repeat-containing protein 2 n=1 Tax=Condylura cristata TaxID=143302 RepID=UPI000642B913|nr:PREDICTED: tectonin beta-propeller repeat-containing protein 2 [Condylura cristata]
MASAPAPVPFREFCPLYSLLGAIPTKIQRGFRSIAVYLTALDASGDYIAVGSSIGMLYLYCRHLGRMRKYSFEGKTEPVTVVKLLSCFDDLVAAGTASGRVAVFQLVSSLPGRNKQLRRFDVSGIHKHSITALAWSPNGMKLFSGDDRGKIVYSSLDLDQVTPFLETVFAALLLEKLHSYLPLTRPRRDGLAVTGRRRHLCSASGSFIFFLFFSPDFSTGKFGACFIPGLCKQSDLTLYASRPGLRLWKADVHGTVQATFVLKDVFAGGVTPFELYPRLEPADEGGCSRPERRLGLVSCFSREGWVLSWNEYSIFLLDTVHQATIAGLEGSGDIVSVSCTENEIFFLKGDRNIIRISSRPEGPAPAGLYLPRPLRGLAGCCRTKERRRLLGAPTMGAARASTLERLPGGFADGEARVTSPGAGCREAPQAGRPPPAGRVRRPLATVAALLRDVASGQRPCVLPRLKPPVSDAGFLLLEALSVASLAPSPRRRPHCRCSRLKVEGASGSTCHGPLESTPCCELPGDSPRAPSADLQPPAPGPGTDSPGQERRPRGERSVLQEGLGPAAPCAPEAPEPAPRSARRDSCDGTEAPPWSPAGREVGTPGVPRSALPPREDEGGPEATELEEEPSPGDHEPSDRRSPCQDPGSWTEAREAGCGDLSDARGACSEVPLLGTPQDSPVSASLCLPHSTEPWLLEAAADTPQDSPVSASLCLPHSTEPWLLEAAADPGSTEEPCGGQGFWTEPGASGTDGGTGQKAVAAPEWHMGKEEGLPPPPVSALAASTHKPCLEQPSLDPVSTSSDEEDIYAHGLPSSSSETSVTELGGGHSLQDVSQPGPGAAGPLESGQFAESWMGYAGPGYGILSLAVSEKYVWCLDYKGGLFCSALPGAGLCWQKFADGAQQVAVSPSGALLWKIEQKTHRALACGRVTGRGKRHWYEALPRAVFVALSDDAAWVIRTNGDLYLQTGLSADRPCARAVKVDCPYPLAQVTARNCVVWALTEQRALLYREGVSSFCPEGEQWKCDIVSERQALEPVCITLGDQQTLWALDVHGNLWFRTGVVAKKPQGDDGHWWQVSITDYVVFDQGSLFQTIIHATHSVATAAQVPVEKVADKLRLAFWSQQLQCQPSLLGVNHSGVWLSSGKNEFHVAKGSLLGAVKLTSLACGHQHVWACDSRGGVYFRVGTQPLNPSLMLPAWIAIEPPTQPAGATLVSVYSSPNDQMLWALDSRWSVHVRTGVTEEMPVGTAWEHVPGLQACQLALSSRTVWARCPNGDLARRYGVTDKNPAGDYWKKVPGNVTCFSVTAADELWAVGPPGYLLQRLTRTFSHSRRTPGGHAAAALHPEQLEDEWEVI